jgi:hypothetical protein
MELSVKLCRSSRILKTWRPCIMGWVVLRGKTRRETPKSCQNRRPRALWSFRRCSFVGICSYWLKETILFPQTIRPLPSLTSSLPPSFGHALRLHGSIGRGPILRMGGQTAKSGSRGSILGDHECLCATREYRTGPNVLT